MAKYFWMAYKYPSQNVSLRSASTERVLLQVPDVDNSKRISVHTIGEVDVLSSYWMTHPGAIYIHEGMTFLVRDLNLDTHIASLEPTNVDYFTEPRREVLVQQVEKTAQMIVSGGEKAYGEIQVTSNVIGYRKLRWYTNETLGLENLDLPPYELLTTGYWLALSDETIDKLKDGGLWSNTPNYYGSNWQKQRELAQPSAA